MVLMTEPAESDDDAVALAASISRVLGETSRIVAVAESLTSGSIASHLGAADGSSSWFAGGVVAYSEQVKFSLLGVEPGPVITARCAGQMARGVADLTNADAAVAVTGVGGPGPEEGEPAGTVFIAVHSPRGDRVERFHFDGEPADVVRLTTRTALRLLHAELEL
ncbi:MAG: nicotinamide-nucleotide amidase [Microbacteriaceae bacterium]|jgi:nicotinamide-nucleotide amidase|nr:nicotinamide-nucleotide amidase [Microbacteriaceae bacterium]